MNVSRTNPLIRKALAASFPTYTGRKLRVEAYRGPRTFDLYWSGGTRDELVLLDAQRGPANLVVSGAPWGNRAAYEPIDQPAGTVLAVHTIFCGRDAGVTFIVRPPDGVAMPELAGLLAGGTR